MRHATAKRADCPSPPPSRDSTYARALHRACLVLGGVPALALHLGVPQASLENWLDGREDPPQMAFLAAVEILLLHLEEPGRAT